MVSELVNKLHFELEPIAFYFTDEKPQSALQFEEGKRACVITRFLSVAKKGATAVFDEDTYGCPGAGVGLCFGDAFTRDNSLIEYLLSTGDEGLAEDGKTHSRSFGRGERFFSSPDIATNWKNEFPYAETKKKYLVLKPLSEITSCSEPDLILMFANPDQLSALVVLAGFNNGEALNVIAPFGAACQSVAYAYRELQNDSPKAILGFFDISQRHRIPKEMLSLTVTYKQFVDMENAASNSFLTTEAWKRIEDR